MSNLIVTKITAKDFSTWTEFDCILPPEYGAIVITGESGSAKTTVAQMFRWCLLGEQVSNEKGDLDHKPQHRDDFEETSVRIEMERDSFSGEREKISITRTIKKDSSESIVRLKKGQEVTEVEPNKITAYLKEITNLNIGHPDSGPSGLQDTKWWFSGEKLQAQVLEDFERKTNLETWIKGTSTKKVIDNLKKAKEKSITDFKNSVKWTDKEQENLNKLETNKKKTNTRFVKLDKEFSIIKTQYSKFKANHPQWDESTSVSYEQFSSLNDKVSSLKEVIVETTSDFDEFKGFLMSCINDRLKFNDFDKNIPKHETHQVTKALSVIKDEWTGFKSLSKDDKDTIEKAANNEGLHCVDESRGIVLGVVNEKKLSLFYDKMETINKNIHEYNTSLEVKKNAGWQAEGTALKVNVEQKRIEFEAAKSTAEIATKEFSEMMDTKAKLTGLKKEKKRSEIIEKLIKITEKAMEKTMSGSYELRVKKANTILQTMGFNMKVHIEKDEDTGRNELFRIDKDDNLSKLVTQVNYVNPGHKACCFSALVAAELSSTALTIPPFWDDSIAVSDEKQVSKVISGLNKWAKESKRQIWVLSNAANPECDGIRVLEMLKSDDGYYSRNNNDWRFFND
jgi:hypothetical protein